MKAVRRMDVAQRLIGRLMFRLVDEIGKGSDTSSTVKAIGIHLDGVEKMVERLEKLKAPAVLEACAVTRAQIEETRERIANVPRNAH